MLCVLAQLVGFLAQDSWYGCWQQTVKSYQRPKGSSANKQVEMRWSELGVLLHGGYVKLVLPGERAAVLGLLIGGGVGGYFVGRAMDRKTTLIKVLPD